MDWVSVLNVISSAFSLVLAVVAMVLSIVFYRFSDKAQREAEKSTLQMAETVSKLEALYSRLYSDMFIMTRDTMSDMRRSMFGVSGSETSEGASSDAPRVIEAKSLAVDEITQSVDFGEPASLSADELKSLLKEAVGQALDRGIAVEREVRSEDVKSKVHSVVQALTNANGAAVADEVVFGCSDTYSGEEVRDALLELRQEGRVDWSTKFIGQGTIIRTVGSD